MREPQSEIPEEVMQIAAAIGHAEYLRSLPFEARALLTESIAAALMESRAELRRLREENHSLRPLLYFADSYVIDAIVEAKSRAEMNAPFPLRASRYETALAGVTKLHDDITAALSATERKKP